MSNYTQLVKDVTAYVEDKGTKFMDSMPTIISQAQLMVCRALPLEMFTEASFFASSAGQDVFYFDKIVPPISPITVDHLMVHPFMEIVERRSNAYINMHGGRGTPAYFCDVQGGVRVTPKPIQGHSMEITFMTRPELSEASPENWYTQNTYDLVLSAALIEAETFLIDPEQLSTYQQRFGQQLMAARRDHQDMIRVNAYNPLAIAAEPAPKGGSA